MPSKLARNQTARQQAKALARAASQGYTTLEIRGPFVGYQPDVDPNLTDGTSFSRLTNVLARGYGDNHGEVLGLPNGFRQLDPARLPLGDGATLPAAPVTDAGPVVRLDQIVRVGPTGLGAGLAGTFTAEFQLTPMAVTAGDGTTNLSGNMYRVAANGQWTHVDRSPAVTDARALKAGRDGRSVSAGMPDSCVAPFGAIARARNTAGADDRQSGNIDEPAWIFTNDQDEVMVFPSNSDAVDGTTAAPAVHEYEPLCDHISSSALDAGGGNGFKCKSVETWNGRVYFLNTEEAGTRYHRRLRRTAKFTCDPDPTIVGAGHYDFSEFQGEGLRIETLGDVLAVYFSDSVAFMRPTGVPTSPDEPQVISPERGLLGTHCVTPIGRNVHFGIFTDGWWLLDQSGRWQELGIVNMNGKIVPKWRQTFYGSIPPTQRHRIYCYYDQPDNLIYITRPTDNQPDPAEVWIYDPSSDRVFIENYPVTCFGTITPPSQTGTAIQDLPGTIDDLTGTIDSYGVIAGYPKVRVHGDLAGFVYEHRRNIVGYHGQQRSDTPTVQSPAWLFDLGLRSPAGFRNLTTVDRVSLEYFDHGITNAVSVQVRGPTADGAQSRNVQLTQGVHTEEPLYRDAWFRFSSATPGLEVSGVGEFHIRSIAVDLWADPVEPRGR